jgi:hypothetical protein
VAAPRANARTLVGDGDLDRAAEDGRATTKIWPPTGEWVMAFCKRLPSMVRRPRLSASTEGRDPASWVVTVI